MPMRSELQAIKKSAQGPIKILLLGSGGLSIGQGGEFDYSGSQAIKAMREEGIFVIVVNPNIATIQTDPETADRIYLYPVEPEWVEKVIAEEKPHGIVAGFGGQTALNCVMKLDERGILKKQGVLNLGTSVSTLRVSEDRELFAQRMREIDIPIPPSRGVTSVADALAGAQEIGYPVMCRAAFALGGLGSGIAANPDQLRAIAERALAQVPQVLIEKSLQGWKEVEYEVMRDAEGNTIIICNMENIDPMGIHTGDSIVVAPSQTLSDEEFQTLRNACFKIVHSLGIVGECNVQFSMSKDSLDFYVIEVNARLSRSSALASKASGYPIAYIAAKVVLGYDLLELKNPVTGVTCAFYEPAMDYIAIKIPRWDLIKFRGVNRRIGSTMKSVGEVLALGRTFLEAFQKAIRMVTEKAEGLSRIQPDLERATLERSLKEPTDNRIYEIIQAYRMGLTRDEIQSLTEIDPWFLRHFEEFVRLEGEVARAAKNLDSVSVDQWRQWKRAGFGDEQIAFIVGDPQLAVRVARLKAGVRPVVKKIDTTAAEYPSPSNYLYLTYAGQISDEIPEDGKKQRALILGGGTYRIGTSVEFDWSAVSCSRKMRAAGWRSVIINCNPETVSTDYNSSDRLYFEELSVERVLDIAEIEGTTGVVVCMGGQLPNKLALPLANAGMNLLGHSPDTIDQAEDRNRFSEILDRIGVDQARWMTARSWSEIEQFIARVGFPVLVRPSYVLSGAAMSVAYDPETLRRTLTTAEQVSESHPVVISEFIVDAKEVELDGVAQEGEIIASVVSEHIENAGVHSGDATLVVPAQKLYVETVRRVHGAGRQIARELKLNGPFNIQFMSKSNNIKVIECNARVSRSFPFVSKVTGTNLAELATRVMMGENVPPLHINEDRLAHVGVKAAMFSFARLGGVDPMLGVEMASTGEVGCLGSDFNEALLLALEASGIKKPLKGILVSSGREKEKLQFLKAMQSFQRLGIPIYATPGTADNLRDHGYRSEIVARPGGASAQGFDAVQTISAGKVDLVINIPKSFEPKELQIGALIRQTAAQFGCSLLTDMHKTVAFAEALAALENDEAANRKIYPLPRTIR